MLCFGLLVMWCEPPPAPASPDAARFCAVVRGIGGPVRPSRRDTPESARYLAAIDRAYAEVCPPRPLPRPAR